MKTNRNQNQKKGGFSLVEMLVVIAVIGIMAAIAIPAMSNTTETAKTATAKRNAQSLCTLHGSARSGGATFSSTTKEGIFEEMVVGKAGVDLGGVQFKMSPLAPTEKTAALAYCTFDSGTESLTYHEDGVLEEEAPTQDEGWSEWETIAHATSQGESDYYTNYYTTNWPEYQFQALPFNGQYFPIQYRYPL